jgi:hypothetical protein
MATSAQCKRALDLFQDDLSSRKNVVGLGIQAANENHPRGQDMAVVVYVSKKFPRAKLRRTDIVPKELVIQGRSGTQTIPIRVIEQGVVHLEPALSAQLA